MTRICFIGDSHLAALKLGWPSSADDSRDIQPVFFAAPAKGIRDLAVSSGELVASNDDLRGHLQRTSGGRTSIGGDYDHYLVHGLELGISLALDSYRILRRQNAVAPDRAGGDAFAHALESALSNSLAFRTAAKLRQITGAPITLSPVPIASVKFQYLRAKLKKNGASQDMADAFARGSRRMAREFDGRFLPQPARTLAEDMLATEPCYSSGPARFHMRRAPDDPSHMNAQYGAAVLEDFLSGIDAPAHERRTI